MSEVPLSSPEIDKLLQPVVGDFVLVHKWAGEGFPTSDFNGVVTSRVDGGTNVAAFGVTPDGKEFISGVSGSVADDEIGAIGERWDVTRMTDALATYFKIAEVDNADSLVEEMREKLLQRFGDSQ